MARGDKFREMLKAATERSRQADANWNRDPDDGGERMMSGAKRGEILRAPVGLYTLPTDKDDLGPFPTSPTPALPDAWGTW